MKKIVKGENVQSAVDELRQYQKAQSRLQFIREQIKILKSKMSVGAIGESLGIQGGRKDADEKLLELIYKVDVLRKKYREQEIDSMRLAFRIENSINRLKYPQCDVLRKFFCENKKIEQIAKEMTYSYEGIKKIKRNGIIEYAKNLEREKRVTQSNH